MMQSNLEWKMTPEQFCYWLQGFCEIRDKEQVGLSEKEWDIIKDHLQEVFKKVTPSYTTTAIDGTKTTEFKVYPPIQVGDNPSSPQFIC